MTDPASSGTGGRGAENGDAPRGPGRPPTEVTEDTPLSDTERLFVAAYVGAARRNGVEAARATGAYKDTANNLKVQSQRLKKKPNVAAAIAQATAERLEQAGLYDEAILEEMSLIAFGSLRNIINVMPDGTTVLKRPDQIRDEHWAAVKSIQVSTEETIVETERSTRTTTKRTVAIAMHDKRQALANLMEHKNLLKNSGDRKPPTVLIDFGNMSPFTEAEKAQIRADQQAEAEAQRAAMGEWE